MEGDRETSRWVMPGGRGGEGRQKKSEREGGGWRRHRRRRGGRARKREGEKKRGRGKEGLGRRVWGGRKKNGGGGTGSQRPAPLCSPFKPSRASWSSTVSSPAARRALSIWVSHECISSMAALKCTRRRKVGTPCASIAPKKRSITRLLPLPTLPWMYTPRGGSGGVGGGPSSLSTRASLACARRASRCCSESSSVWDCRNRSHRSHRCSTPSREDGQRLSASPVASSSESSLIRLCLSA
mmetsp:Transcript_6018/g.14581  ORF Transcript_6018/g.14581 Transcript_6018/m.14581 type:complete len:240 (-) Transcript_6018:570-1289(-)